MSIHIYIAASFIIVLCYLVRSLYKDHEVLKKRVAALEKEVKEHTNMWHSF
jgi:hypothetical protein